jgi:D-3-phosphoglycerate dehydrogenase
VFKVLITGSSHPHKELERDFLEGIAEVIIDDSNDRSVLLELVRDVDAIMTDVGRIDQEVIHRAKKLKMVVEYGIGVDNIDVEAATKAGVMVCNVPDAYIREVAEHTVTLAMCLAREITKMDSDVKQNHVWDFNLYKPIKVEDKLYGLIGFGRIAREVAKLVRHLCSAVQAYDPYIDQEAMRSRGVEPYELDPLLRECDLISIHVPLTDETLGLIGEEKLRMMKESAVLVNVSRGGIIDEAALYKALKERRIRGAGLDVLAHEPQDAFNLGSLDNVILTPHAAWKSEEAAYNLEMAAAKEVKRVLEGKPPMNLVNRTVRVRSD